MVPSMPVMTPLFCPPAGSESDSKVDLSWLRSHFPILQDNADKIFFDNAATTHKPSVVLDAINEFNTISCANAGRGSYSWSTKLSRSVEESRATVAELIGSDPQMIAFTYGATDSLNLVATTWGMHNLRDGDEVMVCADDHASAVLPWYNLKEALERFNVSIKIVPFHIHPSGTYDRRSIEQGLSDRTRLIALTHIHHLYGMEMDIPELKTLIPNDILISLDVSQSIGHIPIDTKSLGADFISFSGHKMFASNGVGVLWASRRALENLWPLRVGAKSKLKVTAEGLEIDRSCLANIIECGTLNLPAIFSLAAAARFIQSVNIQRLENYVSGLTKYLVEKLKKIALIEFAPGIGACDCSKGYGIVSFRVHGASSSDIGAYLDTEGIFVRTGEHCLGRQTDGDEFVRVSMQLYNTIAEIDRFVEVLADACC